MTGPDGKQLCTTHNTSFTLPKSCPVCVPVKGLRSNRPPAIGPELAEAYDEGTTLLREIVTDAREMATNDAISDTARVGALRIRLSATSEIVRLRVERAKDEETARLAARKPAAEAAPDPRELWRAPDHVEGGH